MQVSKWGNSLAIGLPAVLVEVLGLKAGDQVAITVADADFKFDRLEERGDRR